MSRTKTILSCITVTLGCILVVLYILPGIRNIGLLFFGSFEYYSWQDEQCAANSVWTDQENGYMVSFPPDSEFAELTWLAENRSVKCCFYSEEVYFFKPGQETLWSSDEGNATLLATAMWICDSETETLFIQMLTVEDVELGTEFGMITGMDLTFKKTE